MTTRRRHPLLTIVLAVSLGFGAGGMVFQSVGAFGLFEAFIARTAIRSIGVKIQERNDRAQVNRQRDRRLAAVAAREAALEVRLGLSAEAAERERARFAQMREAIKQTALRERQIISYNARRRIRANLRNTVRDAIKAAVAVDPRAIDALIGMFEGKKPLKAMLEAALSEQPADPRQAFRDLRDRLRDVERAASAIGGAQAIDIKARIRQALLEASGIADGNGPIPDDKIQRFRELFDTRRGAKDALAAFVDDLVPDSPGIDEARFGHDPRWREQMDTIRALNASEAKARLVSSLLRRSLDRIEAIARAAGITLTDEQLERMAREVLSAWIAERYEDGRLVRGKVVDVDRLVRIAINESLGARGLDLLPEPSEPESEPPPPADIAPSVAPAREPVGDTPGTGNSPAPATAEPTALLPAVVGQPASGSDASLDDCPVSTLVASDEGVTLDREGSLESSSGLLCRYTSATGYYKPFIEIHWTSDDSGGSDEAGACELGPGEVVKTGASWKSRERKVQAGWSSGIALTGGAEAEEELVGGLVRKLEGKGVGGPCVAEDDVP